MLLNSTFVFVKVSEPGLSECWNSFTFTQSETRDVFNQTAWNSKIKKMLAIVLNSQNSLNISVKCLQQKTMKYKPSKIFRTEICLVEHT